MFRDFTRQRIQPIETYTWATGGSINRQLPEVGYLAEIELTFDLVVALSAGGALHTRGAHNVISRVAVTSNLGSNDHFNCTGAGAALTNFLLERGFGVTAGIVAGSGASSANDADLYAAPVAMGNNTVKLKLVVPIHLNDDFAFHWGLLGLQDQKTKVFLNIQMGQPTDYSTNATAVTGTIKADYKYYEPVPSEDSLDQPPLIFCRWLEEIQPFSSTGEVAYELPTMGVISQLILDHSANAVRTNAVDNFLWRLNRTDTVYNIRREDMKRINRQAYGYNLPTGVFIWDFHHAQQFVSSGDFRDAFDTEAVNTIQAISVITAGTVLGSGTNTINCIRRIVQFPAVPPAMAA